MPLTGISIKAFTGVSVVTIPTFATPAPNNSSDDDDDINNNNNNNNV